MLDSSVRPKVYSRNEGGRLVYGVAGVSYYLIRGLSLWRWLWWLLCAFTGSFVWDPATGFCAAPRCEGSCAAPVPPFCKVFSSSKPCQNWQSCSEVLLLKYGWFSFWQQNGSCMVSSQPALKQVRQDHAKSYEWWTKCSLRLCDGIKSSDVMMELECWTFTFYLIFSSSAMKFSVEQAAYIKLNHLYPLLPSSLRVSAMYPQQNQTCHILR